MKAKLTLYVEVDAQDAAESLHLLVNMGYVGALDDYQYTLAPLETIPEEN